MPKNLEYLVCLHEITDNMKGQNVELLALGQPGHGRNVKAKMILRVLYDIVM